MDQRILKFLSKHKVCSLTTLLPDGSPHAAALHFSHNPSPLEFYFSTEKTSRKTKGLLKGEKVPGAVVVGFSKEEWITFQMDGEVVAVTGGSNLSEFQKIHYKTHPSFREHKDDPGKILLKFTPNWWRYSDFNTRPATILSSEE